MFVGPFGYLLTLWLPLGCARACWTLGTLFELLLRLLELKSSQVRVTVLSSGPRVPLGVTFSISSLPSDFTTADKELDIQFLKGSIHLDYPLFGSSCFLNRPLIFRLRGTLGLRSYEPAGLELGGFRKGRPFV